MRVGPCVRADVRDRPEQRRSDSGSFTNAGLGSFDSAGFSLFGLGAPTDPAFGTALGGLAPGSGTNFAAGLAVAVGYFQQADAGSHKFLIFLSDGIQNEGGSGSASLTTLSDLGVVSNTFAIGSGSSCSGGVDVSLNDIALGGGTCTAVTDPNTLPDLIPDLIGSVLDKVEVAVDGGTAVLVPTTPSTPADGPVSVDYSVRSPACGGRGSRPARQPRATTRSPTHPRRRRRATPSMSSTSHRARRRRPTSSARRGRPTP